VKTSSSTTFCSADRRLMKRDHSWRPPNDTANGSDFYSRKV
jgi:hypothetical protein